MNDSTTSGFLAPIAEPTLGDDFDDIIQASIVGITGIAGQYVRPRWQPEPPNMPDYATNWCAFGVNRTSADTFSYLNTAGLLQGAGTVAVERAEELGVLHSFYGPQADRYAELYRAGLSLTQNRDTLTSLGVSLIAMGETIKVPVLLQKKWVKRVDVTVDYRRRISWRYQINSITSGSVGLDNELYVTPLNI